MNKPHRFRYILLGMALTLVLQIVHEIVFVSDCFNLANVRPAKDALSDAGLSSCHAAANDSLHHDYHGFHGDGCTLTIFEADYQHRESLWQAIQSTPGWTMTAIGHDSFDELFPSCSCLPDVYPDPDVVFDALYERIDNMGGSDNDTPFNYTRAFYDADSGLFFYFRIDT